MSITEDYKIILDSNMFDEKYYSETYKIEKNIDPIYHFLLFGSDKKYNPSKEFNTKIYLEENPDVKNADINPFVHYILWGKTEGRLSNIKNFEDIKNKYVLNKKDLIGKNGFIFPTDSKFELLHHYDSNHVLDVDSNLFSKNLSFKKDFFNKYNIYYNFFIIPDKSIVCRSDLPFKFKKPYRFINDLDLHDFSNILDETHYSKSLNQLNLDGGEKIFSEIISLIHDIDIEDVLNLLNTHKLCMCDEIIVKKPLYLQEMLILNDLWDDLKHKPVYFYNEESYSNSRVLIFYNSNIDSIKYFFSFYFREVILFYDYGALNRDAIRYFAPDCVLELRNENFIPFYKDSKWINDSVDFLKEYEFKKPNLNFSHDEDNMDKISVIIPVYNVEKYIEQCLDSVINQTFENIEIICVNDGSTDNTLNILKKYLKLDERIILIDTINQGPGAARNFGMKQASGDYVFFVDSDDWISEDALESLYERASKDNIDMLFYQLINYIEENGSLVNDPLNDHICFQYDNLDEMNYFNLNNVKDHLFEIPVCTCAKLYKKSFIDDNGLKFSENIYFEDNEFFYNAFFKCKKCGFLKKHLLYRRVRPDSITGNFREKHTDVTEGVNNTLLTFIKNKKYEMFKSEIINHTFADVIAIFNKAPLNFKQIFYEKIKNEFIGFNELKDDFNENLNENNKLIFDLFIKNRFYINFDSEYKFRISEYKIYDGDRFIYPNSPEYDEFMKNEKDKHYKIGIIIPIYNNGNLTHRTMMSIENQSFNFEDIEVLLINDNSSDETFEIINEYSRKYSNVKSIHVNKSSGSSGTPRNIGINECTSEYMMFLDHDDFFELDALEKLYEEIISTCSDVVFGTFSEIVDKQLLIRLYPDEKHGYFENLSENGRFVAFPPPSIWTKLFKTSFIKKYGILFPTILGEDAIFMVDVLANADGISYLWDEHICFHDLRQTSTTNNVSLKYMQELFVSELYMYKIFESMDKVDYCKYRGLGIIDFALNQLSGSQLNQNEIKILFNLMKDFISAHYDSGSKANSNNNKILCDIILNDDIDSLINYLNIKN